MYWSFRFSISASNEYSWLISFRIDRFDLLALQGTFKSLLQHHSLKTSILWCSAFTVQLSHLYMTPGKTTALTIWTFAGKVLSLLFNMLSRFVTAILSRSKHLLISWLLGLSALILKPKKMKSDTVATFSPSICHEVIGPDAMILNENSSNLEVVNGFLNFKSIQYKAEKNIIISKLSISGHKRSVDK